MGFIGPAIGAAMEHLIPVALKSAQSVVGLAAEGSIPSLEAATRKGLEGGLRAAAKNGGKTVLEPRFEALAKKAALFLTDRISTDHHSVHQENVAALERFGMGQASTPAHEAARRLLPRNFAHHHGIGSAAKPVPAPTLYDQQIAGFRRVAKHVRPDPLKP